MLLQQQRHQATAVQPLQLQLPALSHFGPLDCFLPSTIHKWIANPWSRWMNRQSTLLVLWQVLVTQSPE